MQESSHCCPCLTVPASAVLWRKRQEDNLSLDSWRCIDEIYLFPLTPDLDLCIESRQSISYIKWLTLLPAFMAVCGALCVNYVFYMQCQPIETNEMPRLSSLRGPRSLLFSFFFFFQRKTHLCIKFVHSDSFSSLSLQEFTDFFWVLMLLLSLLFLILRQWL